MNLSLCLTLCGLWGMSAPGGNLRPGMFTLGRASQALRHRTKINAQGMRENMLVGVGVELVWLMGFSGVKQM